MTAPDPGLTDDAFDGYDWAAEAESMGRGNCPDCGKFAKVVAKGYGEYGEWDQVYCRTHGLEERGA